MPTATKRLLLDSDDELNTDSDVDADAAAKASSRPQPFAGFMFYVHGEWVGWTRSKVQRAIERHGGKISKTPAFDQNLVTHLILGGQLWSRQGTGLPDKTVQAVVAANEANRKAEDPDRQRIWLLPLEWVEGSIAAGVKLPEAAYDFERQQDQEEPQFALEQEEELQQISSRSRSPRKMRKMNDATGLSDSQDDEAEGRNKNNETRAVATTEQLLQREESPNEDHNDTEGLARDIALQVANDFEKLQIAGGGGAFGKQAVDENRQREVIASVVASFLSKWNKQSR
ncbi:hypothetical protein RHOSPDRAFT_35449 [Rhodotorula sp. JG-1b]|nr:hypothetical protein RHOSPDRAFT_35449 [Rhodotorula sp. JG-1b]